LASGVNSLRVAANQFDDLGRCANRLTKIVHGGCFIEGTLVTVSSLPGQSTSTDSLWSDPSWLDEPSQETPWLAPERFASVATRTQLQIPFEAVPIGARVPTKNPNRFEVDPQPEPDQATWDKLSITVERSDGGIVDAEIIRPRSWILASGLCAGRMLPLNLPELEVSGLALVTAIDNCPPIASGEGSVVTARFVTREVHVVASVDVLGADGTVETITGTTIHPVWSVDRQSWVPLAELIDGETLQGLDGLAVVLSVSLSRVSQPVYNIEVHGEHVYQVGELGVVVHNTYADTFFKLFPNLRGKVWVHHRVEQKVLRKYPGLFSRADIDNLSNLVGIPKAVNSKVHLSIIRKAWNRFYDNYPNASRSDIEHFAKIIDEWVLKGVGIP
jgi:hypothetical protein